MAVLKMGEMNIRQETEADHPFVWQVVKTAFASAEHSDGKEQELVEALRKSRSFIPELSLVADIHGKIAGHILFTQVTIGGCRQLALAPLSVLPQYQKQGVGMALMDLGHCIARELGYDYCVVLGHERYYPKAGYCPASFYGIKAPFAAPDKNFMAIKLNPLAKPLEGVVLYDRAFGIGT